jgi:hypothetical protein
MVVRDAMPSYVRQAYEEIERRQKINAEIEGGEFLRVVELRKADGFAYPRIIGTVADVLKERREAEYRKLLETVRKNSLDIEVEVAKAISRTLTLKRKEVVKSAENVRKLSVSELLPKIALHGGLSWKVLKEVMLNGDL